MWGRKVKPCKRVWKGKWKNGPSSAIARILFHISVHIFPIPSFCLSSTERCWDQIILDKWGHRSYNLYCLVYWAKGHGKAFGEPMTGEGVWHLWGQPPTMQLGETPYYEDFLWGVAINLHSSETQILSGAILEGWQLGEESSRPFFFVAVCFSI